MSNPFTSYFVDQVFAIREDDITMSVYYLPKSGMLDIGVYDRKLMGYTHRLEITDSVSVEEFFQSVEQDYSVVIPDSLKERVNQYVALLPQSFFLHGASEGYECETCGWNDNEITGYYFPAVNDAVPATIDVFWNVGCFGGEGVNGEFSVCKDEAVENITYYLESVVKEEGADSSNAVAAAAFLTKIIVL